MLYSNNDTLSFEDVKANLMSKVKFDPEDRAKKGEDFSGRGESFDKGSTSKSKFETLSPIHHELAKATFVEYDSDGDALFVTSTKNGSVSDWILDSRYTYHMSPHKDWFSAYDLVGSTVVYMGNNAQCNVVGIGIYQDP